jgi:L-serine dehydratase
MGPKRAAMVFRQMYPEADFFRVYLYGSLALTGKGHLTDKILLDTFAPYRAEVVFDPVKKDLKHENTLDLHAYRDGAEIGFARVYSVGGGSIEFEGEAERTAREVYTLSTFNQITEHCTDKGIDLAAYVLQNEPDILGHMELVWRAMKDAIKRGLAADGILPGELHLSRKAKYLLNQSRTETPAMAEQRVVSSYAYAVA